MNAIMHIKSSKQYFILIFFLFIIEAITANSAFAAPQLKISPANLNGNKGQGSTQIGLSKVKPNELPLAMQLS